MTFNDLTSAAAGLPASTALLPLQRAAMALASGDLPQAHERLQHAAQRLAARAVWLEDDLRCRHEALAQRLAEQAARVRARIDEAGRVQSAAALAGLAPRPTNRQPATLPAAPHPLSSPPAAGEAHHQESPATPDLQAPAAASGERLSELVIAEPLRQMLMTRYVLPLRHPQQAARYRQRAGGGLLLYGPPGTGKTHLVRALARELAVPVISLSPSEVLSKWLGESERQLAEVFARARRLPAAVVFIDEIDVLAPRRDAGTDAGGPLQRLLAQLLSELDGFRPADGQVLFIGATNRPWALDDALLRPGRLNGLAYVGLPNLSARGALLRQALAGVPLQPGLDWAEATRRLAGRSVAETLACANAASRRAFERALQSGRDQQVSTDDLLQAVDATAAGGQADRAAFQAFSARHGVPWDAPEPSDFTSRGAASPPSTDLPVGQAMATTTDLAWPVAAAFEPLHFVKARDLHLEMERCWRL